MIILALLLCAAIFFWLIQFLRKTLRMNVHHCEIDHAHQFERMRIEYQEFGSYTTPTGQRTSDIDLLIAFWEDLNQDRTNSVAEQQHVFSIPNESYEAQ
jgi:predicted nucleotidyltransferase